MRQAPGHAWLGLIELFVVLTFVVGWGILELVTLRMDRRRSAQRDADSAPGPRTDSLAKLADTADGAHAADAAMSKDPSRHPER